MALLQGLHYALGREFLGHFLPEKSLSEGCKEPESRFCGRVESPFVSCQHLHTLAHTLASQTTAPDQYQIKKSVHGWMDGRMDGSMRV